MVRRMFADVEADVYVMVDGDDTYDAASVKRLIEPILYNQVDMVNAVRQAVGKEAFRPGHSFGNALLTTVVSRTFGNRFNDMLSGYRAMSRRFVKSFPALSEGFEIETEITVHALELGLRIAEVPAPYKERPKGSVSKLNTLRDGIRILLVILLLLKAERPFQFFAVNSAVGIRSDLRARFAVGRDLSGDRTRAPFANCRACYRPIPSRTPHPHEWSNPRDGHPRPARSKTHALFIHPGARASLSNH